MIHSYALEFSQEQAMITAANELWNKQKITGEMEMRCIEEDRWRLTIHSERSITDRVLEKSGGKRVQARLSVSSMKISEKEDN